MYLREIKKYPGGAPKPRPKDIEDIEDKFSKYVFYKNEKKAVHVITTCCHQDTYIDNMPRLLTPNLRLFLNYHKHNAELPCPLCGKPATVKAIGRVSDNLYDGFTFAILTRRKSDIYSIHVWAHRRGLEKDVSVHIEQVCKYQPGKVTAYERSWYTGDFRKTVYSKYNFKSLPEERDPLYTIGMDNLAKTPFKYIPFHERKISRQLFLAAFYPSQMEMLLKLEWDGIVRDMLFSRRKNAAIFDWDAKDPKKAWKISKEMMRVAQDKGFNHYPWILREWLKWKKVDNRITIEDMKLREWLEMTKKLPVKVNAYELLKYCKKLPNSDRQTWLYKDYIEMAWMCERNLTVPNILYPRNLRDAHDDLTEEAKLKMKRLGEAKEEALQKKAWENLSERSAKYNFAFGEYFVRVALSGAEVRKEGEDLVHCVGGYAERHLANKLTILFIRRLNDPNKALYTVEVSSNGRIMQAHGYSNESHGEPKPQEAIPEFFAAWTDWYTHGSKRDKDGKPIIRKKFRKEAA